MQVRIKNLTPQLLIMQLNSGKTVHLSPNETSRPIEHMELNGNSKMEKLTANNSIAMVRESTAAAEVAKTTAGEPQKPRHNSDTDKEHRRNPKHK